MFGKILICPEKICMPGKNLYVRKNFYDFPLPSPPAPPSRSPTFLGKEILISDSAKCDSTPPPPRHSKRSSDILAFVDESEYPGSNSKRCTQFVFFQTRSKSSLSFVVCVVDKTSRTIFASACYSFDDWIIGLSHQFSGDPNHFGPFNHSSVNCPPLLPKWNKKYSYWNIMPLD